MRSVYIETTIPSFYHTARRSIQSLAWREETRRWWSVKAPNYKLFTSEAVLRELRSASKPIAVSRLSLLEGVPLLPLTDAVIDTAESYMSHRLMPREALGDAVHVAVASVNAIDFVLTWNCRHLANANKASHLAAINRRLGLFVPTIVTPYNLA